VLYFQNGFILAISEEAEEGSRSGKYIIALECDGKFTEGILTPQWIKNLNWKNN